MPWGLKRYQRTGDLHFVTFSCYHRAPLLDTPQARDIVLEALERSRRWYGFYVVGYVVMPEHVHLLISEPERKTLAIALQMLKQWISQKLRCKSTQPFWQPRYYDFNVHTERKRLEKLRYLHRNPVTRGLAVAPEDWRWSSFKHYLTGELSGVEVESRWTAQRRDRMGTTLTVRRAVV